MVVKLVPFKGSPNLGYIIARRVCDNTRAADAIIMVSGPRGVGKSIFSLGLAEDIAYWIAKFAGGKPEDYFDIDHVKSVSRLGGIEILSSDVLLKPHSVIILDDAAISISATKHQTAENSIVRDLVTIMRPFRSVLITNAVFHRSIDKGTRSLADYLVTIVGSIPFTKQTLSKVYKFSSTDSGFEMRKFLTWVDLTGQKHRIRFWVSTLPSEKLQKDYEALRMKNSIDLVNEAREKHITNPKNTALPHQRIKPTDSIVSQYGERVREMFASGNTKKHIAYELGLTPYQVDRCGEAVHHG
jgi:hypothetical protein